MSVFIYKLGQRIKTKIGGIEGIITGCCLRMYQSYEISYFVNGSHNQIWLYDFEFDPVTEKKAAGFKNYQQDTNFKLIEDVEV